MIEVSEDQKYTIGSADNNFSYNHIYTDDSEYRTKKISVKIKNKDGIIIDSAILSFDGFSPADDSSHVEIENRIYLLAGKYLACLDLNGLGLNWKSEADQSCCFQLFYINNKFIVHGELCISCFDITGTKIWEFFGKDIFASVDGKNSCMIKEEKIYLLDFEDNEYTLNLDGKMIG